MGVSPDDGNLFSPGIPFHLCSLHTQYSPSVSSAEQELLNIVEYDAGEKQWTRLVPTQALVVHFLQILQSNKPLIWHVNDTHADCNTAGKCRARNKLF